MSNAKKPSGALTIAIELLAIALWAAWVGRAYLDFNPRLYPSGRELGLTIRTHYIWTLLPRCGDCILWNGFFNGGGPAFAELQGAVLHPLVIVTTLLWGLVNGTKVLLVASLIMAGWAQLWLARVIGTSRAVRLWSAAMAVVGGHLGTRMEHGVVGLVLSTAACSLVIPPALDLAMTGRRKAAVLTAITLALALVSGQVYMQLGLLFGVLPVLILKALFSKHPRHRWAVKGFLASGCSAFLMTAILWAPVLYNIRFFAKDIDPTFSSLQPLEYLPLNLVIRDIPYYYTGSMGRLPYPYLYTNYIGWIPVILAFFALRLTSDSIKRRYLWTLAVIIGCVYLCASAILFKPILLLAPTLVAGIRYPSVISGLAIPPLLALAGAGLDQLLNRFQVRLSHFLYLPTATKLNLGRLMLAAPLLWSIRSAYTFSHTWLATTVLAPDIYQTVEALQTSTVQWITFPYGQHFWTIPALEAGIKSTGVFSPWHWKGREHPLPYMERTKDAGISQTTNKHALYTYVDTPTGQIPCEATALGGHIDVTCRAAHSGTLIVHENLWTDWYAQRDGLPVDLIEGPWLSMAAPAGEHHYTFRYRPLHIYLGCIITLLGCAVTAIFWQNRVATFPLLMRLNQYVDFTTSVIVQGLHRFYRRSRTFLAEPLSSQQARPIVIWTSSIAIISMAILIFVPFQRTGGTLLLKLGLGLTFAVTMILNTIIWAKIHQEDGLNR